MRFGEGVKWGEEGGERRDWREWKKSEGRRVNGNEGMRTKDDEKG